MPEEIAIAFGLIGALAAAVSAIGVIVAIQSRKRDKDDSTADKIADLKTIVEVGNADSRATREAVADMKADLKAHGKRLEELDRHLRDTDDVAHRALDKASAAHKRLDAAGVPSSFSIREEDERG